MTETGKTLLVALLFVFALAIAIAFSLDAKARSPELLWAIRAGSIAGAAITFGVLLRATARKDQAPDFLRTIVNRPFERRGFTFAIVPGVDAGVLVFHLFFQNRYANRSHATVTLRPRHHFWSSADRLSPLMFRVECPGGAFGSAVVPCGVPLARQGSHLAFDVSADVRYPSGRGRMLRFQDGIAVSGAGFTWRQGLTFAGLLGGSVAWHRRARLELHLPTGVAEHVSSPTAPVVEVHWEPGDDAASVPITPKHAQIAGSRHYPGASR